MSSSIKWEEFFWFQALKFWTRGSTSSDTIQLGQKARENFEVQKIGPFWKHLVKFSDALNTEPKLAHLNRIVESMLAKHDIFSR